MTGAPLVAVLVLLTPPSPMAAGAICGNPPSVTLDIGHTLNRPGAISARGKTEYAFNRTLALDLAAGLVREKVKVGILNEAGDEISLSNRARRLGAIERGIILSLHHDSVQKIYLQHGGVIKGNALRFSRHAKGYSLFVSGRSEAFEESQRLAVTIGRELRTAGFAPSMHHAEPIRGENRPVLDPELGLFRFDGLSVLRAARVPAILFEAGVIANPEEEFDLGNPVLRGRMVAALTKGITAFCGLAASSAPSP